MMHRIWITEKTFWKTHFAESVKEMCCKNKVETLLSLFEAFKNDKYNIFFLEEIDYSWLGQEVIENGNTLWSFMKRC